MEIKNKLNSPIIYHIDDKQESLEQMKKDILDSSNEDDRKIILDYPTVYIHNYNDADEYEVYIGETANIMQRTKQHYNTTKNKGNWHNFLDEEETSLYIIGHEHFNKSLTLDVENRLMHYMSSVRKVRKIHNKRSNPQNMYYTSDELDDIFDSIWTGLRKNNKNLFPSKSVIEKSAIFKASPLHKLTPEQEEAKQKIIDKIRKSVKKKKIGQIVFVSGEAGTGKTVLNSSLFYELCANKTELGLKNIKCHLLVNHDQQLIVYQQIVEKLLWGDKDEELVSKPTRFIQNHSEDEPVDVVLVDEAHLLWTQGKQAYRGKNQLLDILKRAKVVVIMFDKNQVLRTEQYWENELIEELETQAKKNDNYIKLDRQLRIRASQETIDWIEKFTKEQVIDKIPRDDKSDIKICQSPDELQKEIRNKAENTETELSRIVATFDWEYKDKKGPEKRLGRYWEVMIDTWKMPWNLQLPALPGEKKNNKRLAWAEQKQTIDEVGSTFTIQGFDLNYVGVILGPSVQYRDGKIVFVPENSKNQNAIHSRTLSDGSKRKFGELLIKNSVNVLMTRGVDGLYIYAYDPALREALMQAQSRR